MNDQTLIGDHTLPVLPGEGVGGRIGPFKILQQIGEGGFGSVFEAEQEQPVKRRVALKVIKLGMDTREVIARFDAERQALALMDHPHIARVLDAGATMSGRPYFVMELVQGEPISSYCCKHELSIVQRLRLFDQVCAAVQHAHTKGIIHRDLKPNNVLVGTENELPFAKVIDFGIAKATSGKLTDKTLFTEANLMMGTPLYMSPEQSEGSADIDTRTDIYALGVILYELLTDTTPIDANTLRKAGYAEVQRIIREVEPLRPSARLSRSFMTKVGAETRRGGEPRKLAKTIRGDLDWIVMKAIEKDRTRRYETANALALDVRRYLAGEAVLAAPPGAWYRMRKFVRRNKGTVLAGSLIAAALVAGIAGFARQAQLAKARADELQQVANFQAAMLGQVDPTRAGKLLSDDVQAQFAAALVKAGVPEADRNAQIAAVAGLWQRVNATDAATDLIDSTILKPAAAAIDKQFKDQPVVAATLRQALADRYVGMGLYDAALPLQESALATRRSVLGEEHPDTLGSIDSMGEVLAYQGKLSEAEPYFLEALEKRKRVLGEEHPDTWESLNNVGYVLNAEGKLSQAEPYYREALANSRRLNGEQHANTLTSLNNIGFLLHSEGKSSEAEPYYREALQISRRLNGAEHPDTLLAMNNLGTLLQDEDKLSEAEPYLREVLATRRRVLGEEHPDTLKSINSVGTLLQDEGKLTQAEPYLREALAKKRKVLGEEHPSTLNAIGYMGALLQDEGKLSEAEPYYREALEKRRQVLGDKHPSTLVSVSHLGGLFVAQGKYDEAERLLAPSEAAVRTAFSGSHADQLAAFLLHLGEARTGLGKFASAEADLLEAQPIWIKVNGPKDKNTRKCTQAIIALYTAWNTSEPGKGHDAKAAEWQRKLDGLGPPTPAAAVH